MEYFLKVYQRKPKKLRCSEMNAMQEEKKESWLPNTAPNFLKVYQRKPKLSSLEMNAMQEEKKESWIPNTPLKPILKRFGVAYATPMDLPSSNSPENVSNSNFKLPSVRMAKGLKDSKCDKGSGDKEMAEMPPLQQTKRKRKNDETVSNVKTPRKKKMYRPKVMGEGKPRKDMSCRRVLNFNENGHLESEKRSTAAAFHYQIQTNIQTPENKNENGTLSDKCTSCTQPAGMEADKSVEMEENPVHQIDNQYNSFQRTVKLNGECYERQFSGIEFPKEFKRKRTARKRKMTVTDNRKRRIPVLDNYRSSGTKLRKKKLGRTKRKLQEPGNKLRQRRGNAKDRSEKPLLLIIKRKSCPVVRLQELSAGDNRGQLAMRWLDMKRVSLRNSELLNSISEESPPDKHFSLTGIMPGSANESRSDLQRLIRWNTSQGTLNHQEHIKLADQPIGTNCCSDLSCDGSRKEGTDFSKKKLIIPYASDKGNQTLQLKHNAASRVQSRQASTFPYQYHTPFNSTKKRQELDKVYLDPRNITMWELLVKNEGNFGKENVDANTAKWWRNERQVFRGRIDAFIARLNPILGDRRFSQWKGSVVDSVVGVFLTQNVSDHHSSSAFMSLAAAFPLPSTRNPTKNYEGQETVCIQESTASYKGSFECERKFESNKTIVEEAEECMSSNLETTTSKVLHAYKSTFVPGFSSDRSSKVSCENNQENKHLESNEMDYRNQSRISGSLNHKDATNMRRSSCKIYLRRKCNSETKSVLEKYPEVYNCCQGMSGVDLWFTPNEQFQRLDDNMRKVQSQEIRATHDANEKCSLSVECCSQTKNGIEDTTENYNSYRGKTEVSPQLSPNDELSEKLVTDVEKVQSQERKVQAPDKANDTKKKGKKGKHHQDLNNRKQTENPVGHTKKIKEKQEIDWDSLQRKWDTMRSSYSNHKPRSSNHMDFVNWEAVRCAEPSKIAEAIKERGQHNIIAGRIKEFLDRVTRIHGSIDLEWLRNAPPDDVKEYLLGINGIGLKSVECVRLLALQQMAFPVDINVGRIAVRLGWVPLEPLPEEVQIHLLELFPMMNSIQRYLWPRLCTLDQRTLYELHYQLITFGKVFCTKRKPNCNACPLRGECRHYASAFASAKLMLPGPTEKRTASSMVPYKGLEDTAQLMNPALMLHMKDNPFLGSRYQTNKCGPIIEEPSSPEPEYAESPLTDIEDLCGFDSDDIPTIRLNSGQFTTSQKYLDIENEMLQDSNITRALVPLNAKAAYIPMRKLKHVFRLRTEHQVYELPDTHPLLFKLEAREPSDPYPYLLCILTPGENASSFEPLNTCCMYQESGELCSEGACSSCNIIREQNNRTLRGTILIPCRTAMRGVFPLNGTYFQVNEVFADHETSKEPIHVPRQWIWNLPRRTAYFGTSTTTIFRGLAKEEIQYCFLRGFICVRGFDRKTRTPKRLVLRLHMSTSVSGKIPRQIKR